MKIHTSRLMASMINTSCSKSLFLPRCNKITGIPTIGDGTLTIDNDTLMAGDNTLAIGGGTLTVDGSTLTVASGTLMSDD
jgi:hypothetical protein